MTQGINNFSVEHKTLAAIFFTALAVRLLNVVSLADVPDHLFSEDSAIYWSLADKFLQTGRLIEDTPGAEVPITERMPLYILFLAAIKGIFGAAPVAVVGTQAVLDSISVVLIALLGGMLSRMIGVVSGLLAALWPNLVINSSVILTDSLFLFLFRLTNWL